MHRDRLNAKYDADAQVKRLVWSMGKTFQKLSANKTFFLYCVMTSSGMLAMRRRMYSKRVMGVFK